MSTDMSTETWWLIAPPDIDTTELAKYADQECEKAGMERVSVPRLVTVLEDPKITSPDGNVLCQVVELARFEYEVRQASSKMTKEELNKLLDAAVERTQNGEGIAVGDIDEFIKDL